MGDFIKPTQQRQKYTQVDPMVNVKPQQQYVEDVLRGQMGQGGAGVFNPYAPPNPWQTQSLEQLGQMQQAATPAFGTGLETTERTVGGGYLDPMQQAGFSNVAQGQRSMADQLFGQMMANPRAAIEPRYASIPSLAQRGRAGERMRTMTEADIAQAGLKQYGDERGLQQAAMLRGAQFAPTMAGRVFQGGEALRAGEQAASTAQLMAQMRARGYDQQAINTLIQYLDAASGKTLMPVTGPSPYSMAGNTVIGAAKLYAGCWIAAELYGEGSLEYHLARYWIFGVWQGPLARWVQRQYRRHGEALARVIRREPWLRRLVRPVFDRAVANGAVAIRREV
jgi:hypothetical protein